MGFDIEMIYQRIHQTLALITLSLLSFQLDKEHNTPHCRNPFPPHRPSNTILAIFPPIFTQYDDLVRNLKNPIEKENAHVFIPLVKNIIPCIDNGSPT